MSVPLECPINFNRTSKDEDNNADQHPIRKTLELTDELKTDSDLCPVHERPKKTNRESQRICRCAQIKLLKEKTIEKIRLSQESEKSAAGNGTRPSSRRLTKEEVYTGIMKDGTEAAEFIKTAPEPLSVPSSSENLAVVEIAGEPDKSIELMQESAEFITLPKVDDPLEMKKRLSTLSGSNRSSREERYSQLIDNDMFGGVEVQDGSYQRLSILQEKLLSGPMLKTKEDRYSAIFDNDALAYRIVETSDVGSQIPSFSSVSVHSNQKVENNSSDDLMFMACPINIKKESKDELEPAATEKRHSCNKKFILCSESCASHQKPHQCSQKAPSCASSCLSCQSHIKSVVEELKARSKQYDADDEKSSMFKDSKGSERKHQLDCEPSIISSTRVCACSQKYPELFKQELSK